MAGEGEERVAKEKKEIWEKAKADVQAIKDLMAEKDISDDVIAVLLASRSLDEQ